MFLLNPLCTRYAKAVAHLDDVVIVPDFEQSGAFSGAVKDNIFLVVRPAFSFNGDRLGGRSINLQFNKDGEVLEPNQDEKQRAPSQ